MNSLAREFTTTVTQRGQVTIPAEVRRLLGTKPKGKITFSVQGDQVCLRAVSMTLESAYGSVKPSHKPEDFKRVSRVARDRKAEEIAAGLARR